jgi:hypothetical protein
MYVLCETNHSVIQIDELLSDYIQLIGGNESSILKTAMVFMKVDPIAILDSPYLCI